MEPGDGEQNQGKKDKGNTVEIFEFAQPIPNVKERITEQQIR